MTLAPAVVAPDQSRHLEMLRLAERMAGLGHWHIDLQAETIYWSPEIYRIHGLTPDQYEPELQSAIRFYHADDVDRVGELVNGAIERGEAFDFEARLVRPGGEIRDVLSRGEVQTDRDGKAISVFGIFLDVTDKRRIERSLQETHERYDAALRGSGAGLWDWDLRTDELFWSPQFMDLMGVPAEQFGGKVDEFMTRLHPEDADRVGAAIEAHLEVGEVFDIEYRLRRNDGRYLWIKANGQVVCDGEGRPQRMSGSVYDISDRKLDEEMREEIYTLLTNARLAPADHFAQLLRIGRRYLGLDVGMISRISDDRVTIRHIVGATGPLQSGQSFPLRETHCSHLGNDAAVYARADAGGRSPLAAPIDAPVYIGVPLLVRGRPYGSLSFLGLGPRAQAFEARERSFVAMLSQWIANEIAQIRAREQMEASREVLRQQSVELDLIFNLVPSSIWFMDDQLRVLRLNEQAAAVTRATPDEAVGRSIYELMPSVLERYGDEIAEIMQSGNAIIGKVEDTTRPDGSKSWVRIDKVPFDDPVSKRRRLITVASDITEFVESQRSLEQHAALLERSNRDLDDFAYVASHDLRAPMRGIENLAQWIEEEIADVAPPETREKLEMLRRRVTRMDRMLTDMLAYSRAGREDLVAEAVNCREVLEEVIEWVRERYSHEISITSDIPVVVAPRTTLQQVLLNLILNAAKHHDKPSGGRIEISCQAQVDEYCFSVIDDGPGIPERFRQRIFKMFEKLEPRDDVEGSGMGLAIVERLVESVGGRVTVRDGLDGRGSEFRVYLPAGGQTDAAP